MIKNRFEFMCLRDLNPKIKLVKEEHNFCVYKIIVNKNYLSIEHITVEDYYLIINKFLSSIFRIISYWTTIDFVNDNVEVLIDVNI